MFPQTYESIKSPESSTLVASLIVKS